MQVMEWKLQLKSTGGGWEVHLLEVADSSPARDKSGQALLPSPRTLRRFDAGRGEFFPLPPEAELPASPDDETARLCAGTDPQLTLKVFKDLVKQSISAEY